ncbi:MAG TPA: hypothetical protein VFV66_17595, partial [Nonomuraea sp.]|nr:hypothetical protein [Nonomuraea sp.]
MTEVNQTPAEDPQEIQSRYGELLNYSSVGRRNWGPLSQSNHTPRAVVDDLTARFMAHVNAARPQRVTESSDLARHRMSEDGDGRQAHHIVDVTVPRHVIALTDTLLRPLRTKVFQTAHFTYFTRKTASQRIIATACVPPPAVNPVLATGGQAMVNFDEDGRFIFEDDIAWVVEAKGQPRKDMKT